MITSLCHCCYYCCCSPFFLEEHSLSLQGNLHLFALTAILFNQISHIYQLIMKHLILPSNYYKAHSFDLGSSPLVHYRNFHQRLRNCIVYYVKESEQCWSCNYLNYLTSFLRYYFLRSMVSLSFSFNHKTIDFPIIQQCISQERYYDYNYSQQVVDEFVQLSSHHFQS